MQQPRRLRDRGLYIPAKQWNRMSTAQQRDIIRQSDARYKQTRQAGRRPSPATIRRRIYKRSQFGEMPSKLRHKPSFQRAWVKAYGDEPDLESVTKIKDDLYDFAKREDTEEAWTAFREVYNQWSII